uniref:C-C motif chemokine n=1 Tax=Capra hircus TaxID=9925 RepID=A0A8C2RBW2_CAPHI
MEVPGAALAVLLLTAGPLATFPLNSVPSLTVGANTPTACCFSFVSRQIPRKFVDDYYETSSQCSKPGVIFQTRNGRSICADPGQAWVQKYIKYLDQKSKGAGYSGTFTVEGK